MSLFADDDAGGGDGHEVRGFSGKESDGEE